MDGCSRFRVVALRRRVRRRGGRTCRRTRGRGRRRTQAQRTEAHSRPAQGSLLADMALTVEAGCVLEGVVWEATTTFPGGPYIEGPAECECFRSCRSPSLGLASSSKALRPHHDASGATHRRKDVVVQWPVSPLHLQSSHDHRPPRIYPKQGYLALHASMIHHCAQKVTDGRCSLAAFCRGP